MSKEIGAQSTRRMVEIFILIIAIVFVFGAAQCGGSRESEVITVPPPVKVETPPRTPPVPIRIAVGADKTGSTHWTRTQQLQPDDVEPLIKLLRRSGGEIAVGLISDDSNRSLLRLRIEVPPVEPVLDVKDPQVGEVDAYELAEQKKANDQKRAEFAAAHDRYVEARKQWEASTQRDVDHFLTSLKSLLAVDPNYRATDIWGAITRYDLYLSEDDSSWGATRPIHKYLAMVSDGEDNVHAGSTGPLKSGAKLLLVNGSASVGSLAPLNPQQFESVQAAFRYITAVEGGNE